MSALTVAKQIARELGFVAPTSLVSNTNQDAVRLLACINAAGTYLAQQDWNSLLVPSTISISAGVGYPLPSDYRQIVSLSFWNATASDPVTGPVSLATHQSHRYGLSNFTLYDEYTIQVRNGTKQLIFTSSPSSADQMVYFYYSKGWVNSGGNRVASVSADSDDFWIPEEAIYADARWRFLKAIGQPYAQEKDEGTDMWRTALAHDLGGGVISTGRRDVSFPVAVVPETDVGL